MSVKPKKINVSVEIGDLYQFLISECRYGYRRNNHLMPGGAYTHVKEYLPLMYKKDKDHALHTACQLCDECISEQLTAHFYDALDDEFGNRKEAIEFIEYLLDWITENGKDVDGYSNYVPYNYNLYEDNLVREKTLRYRVYELESFKEGAKKIRELTTEPVTFMEAEDIIYYSEFGMKEGDILMVNRIDKKLKEYPIRVIGTMIRVAENHPKSDKAYLIELAK